MTRPTVFLDFDDTLVQTCPIYREAHRAAALLIADAVGVGSALAGVRIDRIDRTNAAALGFGKDRFPSSLVETYRSYVAEYPNLRLSRYTEQALRAIGHAVYETEAPVYADTHHALGRLIDTHDIVLVTKGDESVQWRRLWASGLRVYFNRVYVVPKKDAATYVSILECEGLLAPDVWMVGDSMASDINPALAVGMEAVQVVYGTQDWSFERATATGGHHTAESLTEAVRIIQGEHAAVLEALAAGVTA